MARTKIDYGIDLGTTNSAIARIESGEPKIIKTDTLKDTMPSCVYINKKGFKRFVVLKYILYSKSKNSHHFFTFNTNKEKGLSSSFPEVLFSGLCSMFYLNLPEIIII